MMKATFPICLLWCLASSVNAQHLNLGFTFQYHVLKQVRVDADVIYGSNSYAIYHVKDNGWKFFSAGQSIVVGTVAQLNYKKVYAALEPSFDLNTIRYNLDYPLAAGQNETLTFQNLFMQIDVPFYAGIQFKSSNLVRYSFFAGGIFMSPFVIENDFPSRLVDNPQLGLYNPADLRGVLYNTEPYLNALAGIGFHVASLVKIDVRYIHRIGSPGEYPTSISSVGAALTYYLPLSFLKRKIYYED